MSFSSMSSTSVFIGISNLWGGSTSRTFLSIKTSVSVIPVWPSRLSYYSTILISLSSWRSAFSIDLNRGKFLKVDSLLRRVRVEFRVASLASSSYNSALWVFTFTLLERLLKRFVFFLVALSQACFEFSCNLFMIFSLIALSASSLSV